MSCGSLSCVLLMASTHYSRSVQHRSLCISTARSTAHSSTCVHIARSTTVGDARQALLPYPCRPVHQPAPKSSPCAA